MRAIIAIVATVTVITILALHPPVDRVRASWQISLKIKRFAHEWILKLRGLICRADDSSTAFSIFLHGFVAEFSQHFILAHEFLLKARDIFKQTLGRQPQKIESELRVLEIKLFDLLIAGGKDLSVFHALDGLSATIIWREKS